MNRHPAIPNSCIEVPAHSRFGSEVGYIHYIDQSASLETKFYLGLQVTDKHAGAPGRGHGAVSMAILDEVMGRAASKTLNALCYTASMTTNFCSASKVGEFMLAEAVVSKAGKSLVFVDAVLNTYADFEDSGTLVATATGTWSNSGREIPFEKPE